MEKGRGSPSKKQSSYLHPHVHNSPIYNRQDMGTTQAPIRGWTDKEDMVYRLWNGMECWSTIGTLLLLSFSCSVVSDSFVTPWTITHQTPLSVGFPRQGYWNGLPLLSLGIELCLLHWQADFFFFFFFTTELPGKPIQILINHLKRWTLAICNGMDGHWQYQVK